jgi:hypothetical protein
MQLVDSYSSIAPEKALLHRLRVILTVPPIPIDTAAAVEDRSRMVTELSKFLGDISKDNVTLTLDVRTNHCYTIHRHHHQ